MNMVTRALVFLTLCLLTACSSTASSASSRSWNTVDSSVSQSSSLGASDASSSDAASLSPVAFFSTTTSSDVWELGDSLVAGTDPTGPNGLRGYRDPFYGWVKEHGYQAEFVGTLVSPGANPQRHNGHGGDTIAAVSLVIEANYGKTIRHADLVMLMVGTNDCTHVYDPEKTPAAYAAELDQLAAVDPSTTILVTTLQPLQDSGFDGHSADLSAKMPGIWQEFERTHDNPLRKADLRKLIGAWNSALYADGVHFNTAGYAKMAEEFESVL